MKYIDLITHLIQYTILLHSTTWSISRRSFHEAKGAKFKKYTYGNFTNKFKFAFV